MEGIIIKDYFGPDNNLNNTKSNINNKNEKLESEIKEIKDNKNINKDEEHPSDMEIVITKKTSKIIIPKEIIIDKKRSNELTQKLVEKTKNNSKIKLE